MRKITLVYSLGLVEETKKYRIIIKTNEMNSKCIFNFNIKSEQGVI